jgi:hypothetical protein
MLIRDQELRLRRVMDEVERLRHDTTLPLDTRWGLMRASTSLTRALLFLRSRRLPEQPHEEHP